MFSLSYVLFFLWVTCIFSRITLLFICHVFYLPHCISSVQLFSCVRLFATPWTAAHQASLSITNSQSLLKLMFIKSVMPSNHLILYHRLLFPPSVFPNIRVFSSESVLCIMWPKYWSFSFGYPCSPRDPQESSPTPPFRSINSSALSFLLWSNSHIYT